MTSEAGASLGDLVGRLKTCADATWWHYLLRKDPLYRKIPEGTRQPIIAGALAYGQATHDRLTARYGHRPAASYAAVLGVTIAHEDLRGDYDYILISCYTEGPPLIKLSTTTLGLLADLITRESLPGLLSRDGLANLAVAHELFHHLEAADPTAYTRQKTVAYRALGLLRYRVCPVSASEIAAVHFSRLLTGLDYSPAIYELLLLYLQKKDLAAKLIADLLAADANH